MDNKYVGLIVLGISVLIILIIFLFNSALNDVITATCAGEHGLICPMHDAVNKQTYLSLAIVGVLIIFGLVLTFSKPEKEVIVRTIKEKKQVKKVDLSSFKAEEKEIYNLVKENGAMFQADIIERTGFGKAKVSRIIDRLEGSGLLERKRRGMTNVVVLKE
ncbi:MAG: MarR family transcriptional regulator [Nanoarchaeota archaeon]|nr:MarR family transcriptional regulator [Nanoarchaeota archaeon]